MASYDTKAIPISPEDHRISEQEEDTYTARVMRAMKIVDRADLDYGKHPHRTSWFRAWSPFSVIARVIMWREIFLELRKETRGGKP